MFVRDGGNVVRSHTLRVVGPHQTVAAHSHGVACIVAWLYAYYDMKPPADMLLAAAFHDLSEVVTGDMPATAKWSSPALKDALHKVSEGVELKYGLRANLTTEEQYALRFCDITEFALWSIEQVNLGNRYALLYLLNATTNMRGYNFESHPLGDALEELRTLVLYAAKLARTGEFKNLQYGAPEAP